MSGRHGRNRFATEGLGRSKTRQISISYLWVEEKMDEIQMGKGFSLVLGVHKITTQFIRC